MHSGDFPGFLRILRRLGAARGLSPDELTAAVGELAPILARRPGGVFAPMALTAGAFVEWGGSAVALAADTPACALAVMRRRAVFSALWPEAGRLGLSEQEATMTAVSWFDVDHWVNLLITALCRREFRDGASLLSEIGEAARKLGDSVPRAHWLDGLTAVLDDEPVVVIDDTTGRGFRLTMSGVGDNYQLHTLLADRLIGDPGQGLLAGERPAPEWVLAATTAPPTVPGGTSRRFRLYDGTGAYIYPEGKPADIAPLDGARVIVLYPPRGDFRWLNGRTYVNMVPSMTLDSVMTADEAAAWRARIVPARQNDLFAYNPVT